MALVSIVLIGMRSLAVQLSNPFGNDSVDFEIEKFMKGAYTNAVAQLSAERPTSKSALPLGVKNPLLEAGGPMSVTEAEAAAAWVQPDPSASLLPPPTLAMEAGMKAVVAQEAARSMPTSHTTRVMGGSPVLPTCSPKPMPLPGATAGVATAGTATAGAARTPPTRTAGSASGMLPLGAGARGLGPEGPSSVSTFGASALLPTIDGGGRGVYRPPRANIHSNYARSASGEPPAPRFHVTSRVGEIPTPSGLSQVGEIRPGECPSGVMA